MFLKDTIWSVPPKPYYRSTYVFVYRKGKGLQIKSLDDPILKKIRIGVHILGEDYANPPPVHELAHARNRR